MKRRKFLIGGGAAVIGIGVISAIAGTGDEETKPEPVIVTETPDPNSRERTLTAAPTHTPRPTPTPKPKPIEISGKGPKVETINLVQGFYTVSWSIKGNDDRHYAIVIEGIGDGVSNLIANDVGTAAVGESPLRIGNKILQIAPGKVIVSVDCQQGAKWAITISRN